MAGCQETLYEHPRPFLQVRPRQFHYQVIDRRSGLLPDSIRYTTPLYQQGADR